MAIMFKLGCVLSGLALAAAVETSPAVSAAAARVPVAFDCSGWHQGAVRPRSFLIDCGFDNVFLTGGLELADRMRWTWTSRDASSRAVLWVNLCVPYCASGHYAKYPATLTLWRPERHGRVRYYSRLTLRYHHGHERTYTYGWSRRGVRTPQWQGGP